MASQKKSWELPSNYYCQLCRVWIKDTPQARAVHEQGSKHRENVERHLRSLRTKAVEDARADAAADAEMARMRDAARRAYERDQKETLRVGGGGEGSGGAGGSGGPGETSGRAETGGTGLAAAPPRPPDAARRPIPTVAGGVRKAPPSIGGAPRRPGVPPVGGVARARTQPLGGAPRAGGPPPGRPRTDVGGYSMPSQGVLGGAKGLGSSEEIADAARRRAELDRRAAGGGAPPSSAAGLPEAERAARAARDAARARVQKRTLDAFGLR